MADIEAEAASWARTAKDLFAGAAGGVAQVLLGKQNAYSRRLSSIPSMEAINCHATLDVTCKRSWSATLYGLEILTLLSRSTFR